MDRIVIFLILLLMALGYAFWKGGGPERCMAAIMLSMLVFDQALHLIIPAQFASLDAGHLLIDVFAAVTTVSLALVRSEEHTSELQSLMRISYAVFCLKKKTRKREQ